MERIDGKRLIQKARRWSFTSEAWPLKKREFSRMGPNGQKAALKGYQRQFLDLDQLAELQEIAANRIWL
jgi:hypothetical protein